jgi:hypothetical protein
MNIQDTILAITALSGEISPSAMAHIVPNKRYRYIITEQLQANKLIRPYSKDKAKGYRMTVRGKRQFCMEAPERYASALQGGAHTNHLPSELPRRLRLHRISETLAMMLASGVLLFADEKANLFLSGISEIGPVPLPAFYLSKEIYALGDLSIKTQNARMTGVLLADTGYFLIYNTGSGVMRWTPASEEKMKYMLSEYFQHQLRWNKYTGQKADAIVLGENMELAEKLLTCHGGPHHLYFDLDHCTFAHFHFIPSTPDGSILLRLLVDAHARALLIEELLGAYLPKTLGQNFEYDATADANTPVLFAWDFDMARLQNFYEGIVHRNLKGIVMAFGFQVETLEHYFGDAAIIRPMSLSRARGWLLEA